MSELKLTKNALRAEQLKLNQLERYLPTLQLKKALLQAEVNEARLEIKRLETQFDEERLRVSSIGSLLSEAIGFNLDSVACIDRVETEIENIAGVEIPIYKSVAFKKFEYPLFSTPAWIDTAVVFLRKMVEYKVKVSVAEKKKIAIEKELREVTIRVNLFEKNLIPKAKQNIKKIKVFLGDQELTAVGQAKAAKKKIQQRKEKERAG